MGSLTEAWLANEFQQSLTSCNGYISSAIKTDKVKERHSLKIVWPTVDFVRNSIDGWRSGGSLCFPHKK